MWEVGREWVESGEKVWRKSEECLRRGWRKCGGGCAESGESVCGKRVVSERLVGEQDAATERERGQRVYGKRAESMWPEGKEYVERGRRVNGENAENRCWWC